MRGVYTMLFCYMQMQSIINEGEDFRNGFTVMENIKRKKFQGTDLCYSVAIFLSIFLLGICLQVCRTIYLKLTPIQTFLQT